jgi:ATP-dependent Clp protease protease subunit
MSGENPSNPSLSDKFEREAITIPTIYEDDEAGRRMGYDIFSRLMKDGVVALEGPVTAQSAAIVSAQLLYLDRNFKPKHKDDMITLYINSPGGSVTAGLKIYDIMMSMKHPVRTICSGQAASMGSFLLMAGAPDERFVTPNGEVMIHEAAAGKQGKVTDMDNIQQVFNKTNHRLFSAYEFHTGMSVDDLKGVMEGKDTFMNSAEAKALGLVDHVTYDPHLDEGFDLAAEEKASNDNPKAPAKVEETVAKQAVSSDPALQNYDQKWLQAVYEWKKDWGQFMKAHNEKEAANRGKPVAPAIADNLMEIAKNRKVPKFGAK